MSGEFEVSVIEFLKHNRVPALVRVALQRGPPESLLDELLVGVAGALLGHSQHCSNPHQLLHRHSTPLIGLTASHNQNIGKHGLSVVKNRFSLFTF